MYPALAVAEALQLTSANTSDSTSLIFVGSVGGFERPLVEQSQITFDVYAEVQAGPLHGVTPLRMIRSTFQTLIGIVQALRLIRQHRPQVIFLTGGWVGLPVALAGWLARVPILIFLPDIEPGLAIKVLRHFARRVAIALPDSTHYFPEGQTVVTGYPLRQEVTQANRESGLVQFQLDANRKTLLVFGGSRGAHTINVALVSILPRLLADGVQVIHITGKHDWTWVQSQTVDLHDHPHYHPFDYLHHNMGLALAAADLVVSRAGAGTLAEFPIFGVPSILVPYPFAWRYQKVNADYLTGHGAARTLLDERMSDDLYPMIHELFTNPDQLATMQTNVKRLAQPDGAQRIATELKRLAGTD